MHHQAKAKDSDRPNFHKADWREYQRIVTENIRNAPTVMHDKDSIDEAAMFITSLIGEADRTTIPRVKVPNEAGLRALPPPIVLKLKQKRKLRQEMKKRQTADLKSRINALTREIEEDIKTFEEDKKQRKWEDVKDKGPYGFYKLARSYFNSRSATITYPIKNDQDEYLTSDEEQFWNNSKNSTRIYIPLLIQTLAMEPWTRRQMNMRITYD